jgi:hypothetical protein
MQTVAPVSGPRLSSRSAVLDCFLETQHTAQGSSGPKRGPGVGSMFPLWEEAEVWVERDSTHQPHSQKHCGHCWTADLPFFTT